jgi:hypothetical protein
MASSAQSPKFSTINLAHVTTHHAHIWCAPKTLLSMRNTVFVFALNLKMPLVRKEHHGAIKLALV